MSVEATALSRRDFYIASLAAFGIALSLLFQISSATFQLRLIPLFVVLALGGTTLVWRLARGVFRLEFGSDLLAGIAIVSAAALGQYLVACIIILMLSGGETLEQYATGKASAALEALARRLPTVAHRRSGSEMQDIEISSVQLAVRV